MKSYPQYPLGSVGVGVGEGRKVEQKTSKKILEQKRGCVLELKNSTLDDVSSVIGFSATLRLSAWFGDGGNLYVPREVDDEHLLVKLIGMSAARALCSEWPGEHMSLPRIKSYEDDVRRRMIGRMLEHQFSSREISTHLRMSERRVQQIARELESLGLIPPIVPKRVKPSENLGVEKGLFLEIMTTENEVGNG